MSLSIGAASRATIIGWSFFWYCRNPRRYFFTPESARTRSSFSASEVIFQMSVVTTDTTLSRFFKSSINAGKSSATFCGWICVLDERIVTSTPSQPISSTKAALSASERSAKDLVNPMILLRDFSESAGAAAAATPEKEQAASDDIRKSRRFIRAS